jgi:hypothetical protein
VKDVESDAVAGDCVFDGAGWFERDGVKAEGGFGDFGGVGFAVDFDVWEFPQVRVDDAGGSLANEKARVLVDDKGEETPRSGGRAAGAVREQMDDPFAAGDATGADRTVGAARVFGSANERAEFHERLVEVRAVAIAVALGVVSAILPLSLGESIASSWCHVSQIDAVRTRPPTPPPTVGGGFPHRAEVQPTSPGPPQSSKVWSWFSFRADRL